MSELKFNRQKLLDKLGERWLFEKKTVLLYDRILRRLASIGYPDDVSDLKKFREQEVQHQQALERYIEQCGGSTRRRTPSQKLVEIEAQAFTNIIDGSDDPSHILHVLLDAEMEDNASWEMLMQLSRRAGQKDFLEAFATALDEEKQHLRTVRAMVVRLARRDLAPEARV